MFAQKTRRKVIPLASQALATTNPLTWEIPKTGLLAGLYLNITGAVTAGAAPWNALGKCAIVNRVRLIANSGISIIDISGAHYHHLLRDNLEAYGDPVPSSDGRAILAVAAYDLSMWLPIAINGRDPLGLIMLQNEETQLTLEVEFLAAASVGAGAAFTATVQPSIEVFTVPPDPADYPPLNVIHQIVGDSVSIPGAGEFSYRWPRGNTYVQVVHGCGIAEPGTDADSWSEYKLRVNQSENILRYTPGLIDMEFSRTHGRARGTLGVIPVDLIGSSGLGCYGSTRDMLYSAMVTELESVITATAAATLYTVRRQLISLAG